MYSLFITKIKELLASRMAKDAGILVIGTTIAQMLPALISPLLSRLYAPTQFGDMSLYLSMLTLVGVVAALRYEMAVVIPAVRKEALDLVYLCIFICLCITLPVSMLFLYFSGAWLAQILQNASVQDWWYLVPISAYLLGTYQAYNYWFNRENHYKLMATSKVTQGFVTSFLSLALGYYCSFYIKNGLIWGYILGQLSSNLVLIIPFWRKERADYIPTLSGIRAVAQTFIDYPKHSLPGALFNTIALQVPILAVSKLFGQEVLGYVSMTFRVVQLPAIFITAAIGQVLFQRMSAANNAKTSVAALFKKGFWTIFGIQLPFIILMLLVAPLLFKWIFGAVWIHSGEYAQILAIGFLVKFTASPLSRIFGVANNLKRGTMWQYAYFISTCLVFAISYFLKYTIYTTLVLYTISEVFMCSLYLYLSYTEALKIDVANGVQ